MKRIFVLITAVVTATAFDVQASTPTEKQRTISTSGDSVVYVVPDEANVIFGVESASANLDEATSSSEHTAQQLAGVVRFFEIEPRHFSTDNLQVSLRYTDNNREISAYVVTRTYMVTLKDMKKLEPFVQTLLRTGANRLENVQFRSTNLREHRDKARSMAVQAAKEKAEALATELGCTIGHPVAISASGGIFGGGGRAGALGFNRFFQNSSQEISSAPMDGEQTMPLGQIAIQATVSASFDLIPED